LAYTSHDAAKIAVPQDHAILEPVRQIVEADWDIGGHRLRLTGSWKEVLGPPA
jgi:hypothetical protein